MTQKTSFLLYIYERKYFRQTFKKNAYGKKMVAEPKKYKCVIFKVIINLKLISNEKYSKNNSLRANAGSSNCRM